MTAANDNGLADRLAFGVEEAATVMCVGKSTVWRWIHDKRVRSVKLGGRTLIPREELLRLLDAA
ncbi:excisionase family DNA-binding protein [Brevundimonas sp. SL161]|uniref:excisionase family DNA-binding protein n=1 Tax=Brevundimonas sp. SL161 TaxID=2804613 RepID=UPI003CEE3700